MTSLIIATRNAHKVAEIQAILGERCECRSLRDFPRAPVVIEDAPTFAGNATRKAAQLAHWLADLGLSGPGGEVQPGSYVLADDSGLEVDYLGGAPGVLSARFAAVDQGATGNSSDAENNAKLLSLLAAVPMERRTARFRCVLALTAVLPNDPANASPVCYADAAELQTELFEGTCEGRIAFAPSGTRGFGYDPLFVPDGHTTSFAELGDAIKNRISHRARALEKLRGRLMPLGG